MAALQPGDLRERVAIQTATPNRNSYNEEKLTWATTTTVWAAVVERGGREPIIADRPTMLVSYEVTFRYWTTTAGLSHLTNRLVWRSKTLSIETVTPDQANGWVVVRCLEATA